MSSGAEDWGNPSPQSLYWSMEYPFYLFFFPFKKCSWKCVLIFCTWILYLHTQFYVIYFISCSLMFFFSISTVFLRSIHVLWIHLTLACNSWVMGAYCSMGATTTTILKSISQWWTSRLSSTPRQRKQPWDNLVDRVSIFWVNIPLGKKISGSQDMHIFAYIAPN